VISIIIPNWNGCVDLKDCLASVAVQRYNHFEIIVVDNGSNDDSVSFICDNYPDVKLILNSRNFGFAHAVNQGINVSQGDYVALLNNDTIVDPGWIVELVSVMESDERIGMAAPKILKYDNRDLIDSAGVGIYPDGMSRGRGMLEKDNGQFNSREEILLPSGCAALYRKKMLDEIGEFDETFFAYGEDTDLGLRSRKAGWSAVYVPESVVFHKYSATSGAASSLKAFYAERNRILVAVKNFPVSLLLVSPLYTARRYVALMEGLKKKCGTGAEFVENYSALRLMGILLKSYSDALRKIPEMISKRKKINTQTKLSNKEFRKLLKKHTLHVDKLI